ncbi:unnamed protein product [Bursaphelenchus xylophilus]|uniref:Protein AAR2 homolog n=1 Tax=Bursaphelenchus xylophilus TaxID=6326 RepID=A0A1I7RWZ2_BURXY|nr:unnamed protein product [Bursaphelenchus xylophilus]CAG9121215.1 unnamed protein product [Bursaphelenchus xylophilus]
MARIVSSDENSTTYMMPSHFVAKENELIQNGIHPELANEIYNNGGFIVFPNLPKKDITIGIDYRNFTPTEKFMGFKMIPPGLHYITVKYKEAPTISFFIWVGFGTVYAPKWNTANEDFEDSLFSDFWPEDVSDSKKAQAQQIMKNYDDHLAVYPYPQYKEWQSITSHISKEVFERLRPANKLGKISEQLEFETKEQAEEKKQGTSEGISTVNKDHPTRLRFKDEAGLPVFDYKPGGRIFFTELPENVAGQTTKKTRLERVLEKVGYKELLGEVQYAYVIFLIGQSYVGLDQWKRLLHLLADCSKDIPKFPELFEEFIVLFYFQIKLIQNDFFEDLFTGDNFLKTVIPMLFANISDSDHASATLKKRSLQLKTFCEKKFNRSFEY